MKYLKCMATRLDVDLAEQINKKSTITQIRSDKGAWEDSQGIAIGEAIYYEAEPKIQMLAINVQTRTDYIYISSGNQRNGAIVTKAG